ncbi:MAG TPA: HTH domain-containing protein, partial [Candidatus Nanoarchaeia archaeon]|nr:HTH domain-containing protein [Candidatus Nanoarchaeia archaeon]
MATEDAAGKKVLVLVFKDFSRKHTITSLAQELDLSRVGIWKVLKKLETKGYVILDTIGSGKTSTSLIKVNWGNILVEKAVSLYLTEEAVKQRRWRVNFAEFENKVEFTILFGSILHSPQQASDIDMLTVSKKSNFVNIQNIVEKVQKTQGKKVHIITFTAEEFKQELNRPNKVFIEAIKKGIILFGQEKFIQFMKRL